MTRCCVDGRKDDTAGAKGVVPILAPGSPSCSQAPSSPADAPRLGVGESNTMTGCNVQEGGERARGGHQVEGGALAKGHLVAGGLLAGGGHLVAGESTGKECTPQFLRLGSAL